MTEAFKQGMEAFKAGILFGSNPYSFWNEYKKYMDWNSGYMSVVRHKKENDPW